MWHVSWNNSWTLHRSCSGGRNRWEEGHSKSFTEKRREEKRREEKRREEKRREEKRREEKRREEKRREEKGRSVCRVTEKMRACPMAGLTSQLFSTAWGQTRPTAHLSRSDVSVVCLNKSTALIRSDGAIEHEAVVGFYLTHTHTQIFIRSWVFSWVFFQLISFTIFTPSLPVLAFSTLNYRYHFLLVVFLISCF